MNPGAEFTDWQGGHAGVLFADVVELLTPRTVAERDLGLSDLDVLRQAVARGALVVLQLLDREILRRKRRLFPAGGSDSHELYTRDPVCGRPRADAGGAPRRAAGGTGLICASAKSP